MKEVKLGTGEISSEVFARVAEKLPDTLGVVSTALDQNIFSWATNSAACADLRSGLFLRERSIKSLSGFE